MDSHSAGGAVRALLDAVRAVGEIVSQSLISGAVAFAITLLCALGFFWTGRLPTEQTRVEFLAADMVYLSLFFGASLSLGYSAPLAKHRWIRATERAPSHRFWLARLVRATWVYGLLAAAWIVGVSVASTTLSDRWRPFALHFYVSALGVQMYLAVLDVAARTLYRTETPEGVARSSLKASLTGLRIARSFVNNIGFLLCVYAASIYIHLSSRLKLENQETFVVFSVASILLRVAIMKVLLWIVTRRQKIHIRLLYVLTSVPTVMIGTQVRIALLRVTGSVSVTSVVVLAVAEPLMRLFKVWRVRRVVDSTRVGTATPITAVILSSRPRRSESTIVPSDAPTSIHVKPSVRERTARRMPSRLDHGMTTQLLLQFTAAEIHADMCSEYIAIASSLAIFYCLNGHPRFSWTIQSSATSTEPPPVSPSGRVELVLLQIAVELVIDTLCCLWEVVNGIPLRTSEELNRFLAGLFAGCAVTNICVCCAIYVR